MFDNISKHCVICSIGVNWGHLETFGSEIRFLLPKYGQQFTLRLMSQKLDLQGG